jgi:hypothetical protein
MKRRKFATIIASSAVGYQAAKKYENKNSYNHPPIVYDYDKKPVSIYPEHNGVKINYVPDYKENMILTANKYNDPSEVYKRYEIEPRDGFHKLDPPEIKNTFVYTLYSSNNNYLGESNPIKKDGPVLRENEDKIPYSSEREYPFQRNAERGYFNITILSERVSFPVSYQKYRLSNRILGYGTAQEYAQDSPFLRETGKRIIKQADVESQIEKIKLLTRPTQNMTWRSDVKSVGKYEYIREPAKTFVDMVGDCKDRTVINSGFLENVLGIETSQLYTINHMLTGASSDNLTDETMSKISENGSVHLYNGMENDYLPIESTEENKYGAEYPKTIYALYNDHYQIRDFKGLINHIIRSIPKLLRREPVYR